MEHKENMMHLVKKKTQLYSNMENFENEYGNPFRAGMSN